MRREPNVEYHHDEIDGANLDTSHLLICIADGNGLERGRIYKAEAVTWHASGVTVVMCAGGKRISVCPAERLLRRTFLQVDVTGQDGTKTRHSFLSLDDCVDWRESTGIPYEQFGNFRLVEADPDDGRDAVVERGKAMKPTA